MTFTNIKVHHKKSIHISAVHLKGGGSKHKKKEEKKSDSQEKPSDLESQKVYGLYTKNKKGKPKGGFVKVRCSCSELEEGDSQIGLSVELSEDIRESIETAFKAVGKLIKRSEEDSIKFERTKFDVIFDEELTEGKYSSLAVGVAAVSAFYGNSPNKRVLVAGMVSESGNTTSRENLEFIAEEAEACDIDGVQVAVPNVSHAEVKGRKMFLLVSNLHAAADKALHGFK